jgi:hypothetical protein
MAMQQATYPVQFSVDYPDRPINRLTTAFRIFVAIPILIVLASVSSETWEFASRDYSVVVSGAGGLLFLGPLLMILFRRNTPGGGSTGTWSFSASPIGSASTSR